MLHNPLRWQYQTQSQLQSLSLSHFLFLFLFLLHTLSCRTYKCGAFILILLGRRRLDGTGRISNRHWHSYETDCLRRAEGTPLGGGRRATKLRIHNSFICPYLHIFFLLLPLLLLFGVVKSALRLAFGWLSLPIFRLPPSNFLLLRLRIQRWSWSCLAKAFIKFKSCYRRK